LEALKTKFEKSGGSWKDYTIESIFDIKDTKKKINANTIQFGGKHPYVVRTSRNNGIRGYIDADEKGLNEANTLSFGQDTATVFYQNRPYFTGDKIKIFSCKYPINERQYLFLVSHIRKAFSTFAWGQTSFDEKVLKGVKLRLPALMGQPAFDYMEQYITILEQERLEIIKRYLADNGLTDCELTEKEKDSLTSPIGGGVNT